MIIGDDDVQTSQRFAQIRGDEIEGLVIIVLMFGEQHLQAVANGDSWRDDEKIGGKPLIVGIGEFIEAHPRDEHGHDDGFAAACGHFEGEAIKQRIVSLLRFVEQFFAELIAERGCYFREINCSFEGFELTEEEPLFAFFAAPMFEQVFGASFDVEIAALAPDGHLGAQAIDEGDLAFFFGVDACEFELLAFFGLGDGDEVAGGAPPIEDRVGDAFLGEGEVPSGFGEGGIEDGVGDEPASSGDGCCSRHRRLVSGELSSGRTGMSTTI